MEQTWLGRPPVIVTGDFNIGGPPSNNGNLGSPEIRSVLGFPRDLLLGAWPRFNGRTYDCELNSVAARSDCEGRERIDYVLVVTDPALTTSPFTVTVAKRADVGVVRWQTERERLTEIERAFADATRRASTRLGPLGSRSGDRDPRPVAR